MRRDPRKFPPLTAPGLFSSSDFGTRGGCESAACGAGRHPRQGSYALGFVAVTALSGYFLRGLSTCMVGRSWWAGAGRRRCFFFSPLSRCSGRAMLGFYGVAGAGSESCRFDGCVSMGAGGQLLRAKFATRVQKLVQGARRQTSRSVYQSIGCSVRFQPIARWPRQVNPLPPSRYDFSPPADPWRRFRFEHARPAPTCRGLEDKQKHFPSDIVSFSALNLDVIDEASDSLPHSRDLTLSPRIPVPK